jgi:hypothetical protein
MPETNLLYSDNKNFIEESAKELHNRNVIYENIVRVLYKTNVIHNRTVSNVLTTTISGVFCSASGLFLVYLVIRELFLKITLESSIVSGFIGAIAILLLFSGYELIRRVVSSFLYNRVKIIEHY